MLISLPALALQSCVRDVSSAAADVAQLAQLYVQQKSSCTWKHPHLNSNTEPVQIHIHIQIHTQIHIHI